MIIDDIAVYVKRDSQPGVLASQGYFCGSQGLHQKIVRQIWFLNSKLKVMAELK